MDTLTTTSPISFNLSEGNSPTDHELLMALNKKKATLLIPAILYAVTLMVIGAIGNPLAIFIYGWKWQNTTTRHFLLWLACLDLVNCLITIPTEVYVMLNFFYISNAGFCRMSRFITYVINNATSFVFLAIAVDRYMRICHPHKRACSVMSSKVACVVSLFVGVGVSWPAIALYGSTRVPIPTTQNDRGYIIGVICAVKNEMENTPYPMAFFGYLWFGFAVCVLILTVIYIQIGKVMLKRRREKKKRAKKLEEAEMKRIENENGTMNNSIEVCLTTNNDLSVCQDHHNKIGNGTREEVEQTEPNSADAAKCALVNCGADIQIAKHWKSTRIRPPRSTLMLFAISAVFVLTFLPFLIIMVLRMHMGASFYPSLGPIEQILVNIFSRSYLVNNVANPIVYGMCNAQFRTQAAKCVHASIRRRDSSLSRGESKLSAGVTPNKSPSDTQK